jgi:hypothetical protein
MASTINLHDHEERVKYNHLSAVSGLLRVYTQRTWLRIRPDRARELAHSLAVRLISLI